MQPKKKIPTMLITRPSTATHRYRLLRSAMLSFTSPMSNMRVSASITMFRHTDSRNTELIMAPSVSKRLHPNVYESLLLFPESDSAQ